MVNKTLNPEPEVNKDGKYGVNIPRSRDTSRADSVFSGTLRMLDDLGWVCLTEVSLSNNRRADILALSRSGDFLIVEVKSSLADFASDGKWPEYLDWCDHFAFAVDGDFPQEKIPEDAGLIIADRFGGAFLRETAPVKLAAARRKAMTLKFARLAAYRLYRNANAPVA